MEICSFLFPVVTLVPPLVGLTPSHKAKGAVALRLCEWGPHGTEVGLVCPTATLCSFEARLFLLKLEVTKNWLELPTAGNTDLKK